MTHVLVLLLGAFLGWALPAVRAAHLERRRLEKEPPRPFAELFAWAADEGVAQQQRTSVMRLFAEWAKTQIAGARLAAALRPLLADADEEVGHTPEALREAEDALTAWEEREEPEPCSGVTGTAKETEQS